MPGLVRPEEKLFCGLGFLSPKGSQGGRTGVGRASAELGLVQGTSISVAGGPEATMTVLTVCLHDNGRWNALKNLWTQVLDAIEAMSSLLCHIYPLPPFFRTLAKGSPHQRWSGA